MNNKIDWKRKLSSRKFWALIAALATAILAGVVSDATTTQVVGIITAVGACIAYIFAESSVDQSYNENKNKNYILEYDEDDDFDYSE